MWLSLGKRRVVVERIRTGGQYFAHAFLKRRTSSTVMTFMSIRRFQ